MDPYKVTTLQNKGNAPDIIITPRSSAGMPFEWQKNDFLGSPHIQTEKSYLVALH